MTFKVIVSRENGTCLSYVLFDSSEDADRHINNIRDSSDQILLRLRDELITIVEYKLSDGEWK